MIDFLVWLLRLHPNVAKVEVTTFDEVMQMNVIQYQEEMNNKGDEE
jgi:hypothetical protein